MKYILTVWSLLISAFCFAQGQEAIHLQRLNDQRVKIKSEFTTNYKNYSLNHNELVEIARTNNVPMYIQLMSGNTAKLNYFDPFGQPNYYTIFEGVPALIEKSFLTEITHLTPKNFLVPNIGAAISTGTATLQVGGALGLNLSGKGMTVGIYDQTRPKANHAEFQGRLTQIDGSTETISDHATHVSGTVLARGLNPNAKGMANEATGWVFNWDADLSKMNANAYDPFSKPDGHLVSNHSYGSLLGWYRNQSGAWRWAGNPSINPNTDYRFGYYSTKSKGLDDLLFSKPYYTVVWAAGNDRSDRGDGTKPPDGPEDTIGPEGVAKNAITVGAVNKIENYLGPNSVQMSEFSSWGPTDDGRIKPDIVGIGVNVFSTSVANNGASDSYGTSSGTSMAAPNVTGSLLLLQQLYHQRNSNKYMLSSTVKALMINTAREAGLNPGPDYVYGWGLLDAGAAAKVILDEDGGSALIREQLLTNGNEFRFEFISDGVAPIRATIAWTDPSGVPPPQMLNPQNLMLVNDLDLRIIDEDGLVYFPWSLDPAQRSGARAEQNKDNFRDNVEQVEILNPQPKKYTLVVSHKGSLRNGVQDFSLVMTAGVQDGAGETLYWIGPNGGNWNDIQNWSFSSGGQSSNKIPDPNSRVVFEGTPASALKVNFPADATAFSVNLFGDRMVEFDLKGNEILITNGFRVSNTLSGISNGEIRFTSDNPNDNLLDFGNTVFDNVNITIENGRWQLIDAEKLDELTIVEGFLDVGINNLKLNSLELENGANLTGTLSSIEFSENFILHTSAQILEGLSVSFEGSNGSFKNDSQIPIAKLIVNSGLLNLNSDGMNELEISAGVVLMKLPLLQLEKLRMDSNTTLDFGPSGKLIIEDSLSVVQSTSARAKLQAGVKGELIHDQYLKYCFENLDVINVDHSGISIINLGENATVSNALNWLQQKCEEVLFPKFRFEFNCVGAFVEFENLSEGDISAYLWKFGEQGTSTLAEPVFIFSSPGNYTVSLEVFNAGGSSTFEQEITIVQNSLPKPVIVINGITLTSQTPASRYQWLLNGEIIEGATERSYEGMDVGNYQVAIFNADCNRLSDPVTITSIEKEDPQFSRFGVFIGPNPTSGEVNISISNSFQGPIAVELYDMSGKNIVKMESYKSQQLLEMELAVIGQRGLYILMIRTDEFVLHKKILKN